MFLAACQRRNNEDCLREERCPSEGFLGPDCRCWCPSEDYTAVDCHTRRAIDPSRVVKEHGRVMVDANYNNTYYVSWDKADWFSADRKCRSMGGWLLSVDKPSISERLFTILGHLMKRKFVFGYDTFWTAGNDLKSEGTFVWEGGQYIDFNMLQRIYGEPNNGLGHNEDCLAFKPHPYHKKLYFYDGDCATHLRYLCGMPHLGCYDRSPICSYYSETGQCESFRSKCRKTCGLCGERPLTTPSASPLPSTGPSTVCHSLRCSSTLSSDLLRDVVVGQDICVRCPECLCIRSQLGLRVYPDFARICCAVLQMRGGQTRGIHIITRRPGRHRFPGGRLNGVVSRWADYASTAFTVKGYEPTPSRRNVCLRYTCQSSPMRSRTFKRLLVGQKLCIQCPPACQCNTTSQTVFGQRVYHRRSSACCAVAHQLGRSQGGFFMLKKVSGRSSYSGSVRHGVHSNRTNAVDDWVFRVYPGQKRTGV